MGLQFHETVYGKNFFEGQLPELIESISKTADALKRVNNILEKRNNIYVCYMENSRDLSTENPVIDEMTVAWSERDVRKQIEKWLMEGKENRYLPAFPDEESEFYKAVRNGECAELPLYYDGNENSTWNYSLIVRHFPFE